MMMEDLFRWSPNSLLSHKAGLGLSNGGLEDAHIVDDELEIVVSEILDTRDCAKWSEDALGYECLDDWK